MAHGSLRLVGQPASGRISGRGAITVGAVALACAILATLQGADDARSVVDPRIEARAIADRALERGYRAPEVLAEIRNLRTDLGRNPLSALRRVVYADLLLALSRSPADTPAAAFHASVAADLAPVTVPVVWRGVVLLTRCGEIDSALGRVAHMFSYDADAAAELLAEIAPVVGPARSATAVPDIPAAHVAWAAQLRSTGDRDRARAALEDARERWPESVPVIRALADRAAHAGDLGALEATLAGVDLPARRDTAVLHGYRCILAASAGNPDDAWAAIDTAREAGRGDPELDRTIGDCLLALDEPDAARNTWRAALFRIDDAAPVLRSSLWARIAELDEREGHASDALRAWRRVLDHDPGHTRAQTRVRALGGGRSTAP